MRLRTLLCLAFGLIALAVALCGAFGARILIMGRLERRIGIEMATSADQIRAALDRSMYDRWREISILANVAETTAKTADARRVWIDNIQRSFPAYAWIGFADPDGTVAVSTGHVLEGVSVADRPWFQAGRQVPYAGDLHEAVLLSRKLPAPADGTPWRFVDLSAPIRDPAGKLDAVVGAHLSWSWARSLTESILAPAQNRAIGTEVLVVDQSGTVILGPPALQDNKLPPQAAIWRTAGAAGGVYALETWPDGNTYLVGASRTVGMKEYPGLGWTILVRQDSQRAFAPATDFARDLFIGGLALSVAAALLGWLTAYWISRPVNALADAAEMLGRMPGLDAPPVARGGTEEVRRLSSALVTMFQAVSARDRSLAEANQALEQRVDERTRELQSARLAAESASRAKTRFLAGMSHELRTPLNGILGYAALLQDEGGLSQTQRQRADAMMAAGRHLLDMINRVLDLSEIEADHLDMAPAAVDIRPLVRACLDVVRPTAYPKRLALELQLAADLPRYVMADSTRVRQILLNLLGNAVKFTVAGSVTLHLFPVDDGDAVRIEVADTGPGIPADRRHRLFHEFERLSTSAEPIEGAGLGLALSARMAAMMGGAIGFDDNPGGGSIFWLQLPAATGTALDAPQPGPAEREPASQPTGPLQILVVDDTAMNRDIAQAFLTAAGHQVICVETGQAAIEHAAAAHFDVILMDVRMPGMDGLEATRRIRALAAPNGQVPIVALTAQAFAEQVAECRQAGMNGHLSKPFSRDQLLAVITAAAQSAPPADPTEPALDKSMFDRTAGHLTPEATYAYLGTIAERCEALRRRLQAPDALTRTGFELADEAHALAGSAGMFGFARLNAAARHFEYAFEARASDLQARRDDLLDAIAATLTELDRLVAVTAPT